MDPILIPILAITFAVGVPSIALATHLVLRPLVRDIAGAIRAEKSNPETEHRLASLEGRIEELEGNVTRLVEVEEFRRQLEAGRSDK